jgi:hypothetical protein
MKKYAFKNIEIIQLESLIDESEVTGTLLKAYARIALEPANDGNPAGDAHSSASGGGCDGGGAPSICP